MTDIEILFIKFNALHTFSIPNYNSTEFMISLSLAYTPQNIYELIVSLSLL